jgi:hypothetical protein
MIFIDYVYANIYNWYKRMADNGRRVDPQGLTSVVFGICANGWFLFFRQSRGDSSGRAALIFSWSFVFLPYLLFPLFWLGF